MSTLLPAPWPPIPLDLGQINGVPVLNCGLPGGRCAIRVPKQLGMRAYAYLRWLAYQRLGQPPGGVLLDRRSWTMYFLIMTPHQRDQDRVARCLEQVPDRPRFLGNGALVVLPTMGRRSQRWLGDSQEPTDTFAVVAALRIAGRVRVGPDSAERLTLSAAARAEHLGTFSRALTTW
jgi:hypothetical protein